MNPIMTKTKLRAAITDMRIGFLFFDFAELKLEEWLFGCG